MADTCCTVAGRVDAQEHPVHGHLGLLLVGQVHQPVRQRDLGREARARAILGSVHTARWGASAAGRAALGVF